MLPIRNHSFAFSLSLSLSLSLALTLALALFLSLSFSHSLFFQAVTMKASHDVVAAATSRGKNKKFYTWKVMANAAWFSYEYAHALAHAQAHARAHTHTRTHCAFGCWCGCMHKHHAHTYTRARHTHTPQGDNHAEHQIASLHAVDFAQRRRGLGSFEPRMV